MRTAFLLMAGSRGDHEPMLALAMAMVNTDNFDSVHLCLQSEYTHLVPQHSKIFAHELPFVTSDFMQVYGQVHQHFINEKKQLDPVKLVAACINLLIKEYIVPALPSLLKRAQDVQPSVIVATKLFTSVAACLAESLKVPLWCVYLQPNVPTDAYPSLNSSLENAVLGGREAARLVSNPNAKPQKSGYAKTYKFSTVYMDVCLDLLNSHRTSLGLSPLSMSDLEDIRSARRTGVHALNAFSNVLVPKCQDWNDRVYMVPSMADDYLPPKWNAMEKCPKLCQYLANGEKPFCVNFGSMTLADKTYTTRDLFKALREVGICRVLILKGAADIGKHSLTPEEDRSLIAWVEEHVFVSDEAPQNAWLMPQCKGLLCHGGAGTMAVCLRAGLPVAFCPLLSDQYFWAELCTELGVGAIAGPSLQKADAASFASAIRTVLSSKVQRRASEIGMAIQNQGCGAEIAANLIGGIS